MTGRNVYPQISSTTATANAVEPVILNTQNIMNYYRSMTEEERDGLRDEIQKADDALLIQEYDQKFYYERIELLKDLSNYQKKVIIKHYLDELDKSVNSFLAQNHPAAKIAESIAKQMRSIQNSPLQNNATGKFADEDFLDVLHKTTSFMQTPPYNQDKTPNSSFADRAAELSATSASLRKTGRWEVLSGCLDTLAALMWIGAAVFLSLYSAGVIGVASLSIKILAPLAVGLDAYFSLKDAASAVGHFSRAHKSFSLSNKLNALGKKMPPAEAAQPAEPIAESSNTLSL